MLSTLRKLLDLFSGRERRQLAGLLAAIIGTSLLQVAGVGAVIPFISLLADRTQVRTQPALAWLYDTLGFTSTDAFLLGIGLALTTLLVAGNAFVAFTQWLIARFSWQHQRRLSTRLLRSYLAQPYDVFIARNTADFGKTILSETETFTGGVMLSALHLLAAGVTALAIGAFLLWLDPLLAACAAASLGTAYALVYLVIRRALLRIGARRRAANTARFKAVNEAFGSPKELEVLGRQEVFVARYATAARSYAADSAIQQVLGSLPRYAIEALAFGLVMALLLYVLYAGLDLATALPLAGAFTLAGYRLLPALQQSYQGVSGLRFYRPVLDALHADLCARPAPAAPPRPAAPLPFTRELRLEHVTYTYPGASTPALRDVNLTIARGAYVALVGATGAGKTTLADVILGVLVPQHGTLHVDGVPVTDQNRRAWQANLGYVPQEIYLSDDTLAANIAWGIPPQQVDRAAVERAARVASIHDFILSLPAGYDTRVGERGVRLSGGQRQRIGIARALYHDPQVLVLDEATSALDNETERRIVEELDALRGERTLIVIAHRMSTVRRCVRLYLLDRGQVLLSGSYDELVGASAEFRRLTQADISTQAGRRVS